MIKDWEWLFIAYSLKVPLGNTTVQGGCSSDFTPSHVPKSSPNLHHLLHVTCFHAATPLLKLLVHMQISLCTLFTSGATTQPSRTAQMPICILNFSDSCYSSHSQLSCGCARVCVHICMCVHICLHVCEPLRDNCIVFLIWLSYCWHRKSSSNCSMNWIWQKWVH